jgi:hypothetical protein
MRYPLVNTNNNDYLDVSLITTTKFTPAMVMNAVAVGNESPDWAHTHLAQTHTKSSVGESSELPPVGLSASSPNPHTDRLTQCTHHGSVHIGSHSYRHSPGHQVNVSEAPSNVLCACLRRGKHNKPAIDHILQRMQIVGHRQECPQALVARPSRGIVLLPKQWSANANGH